MREIKTRKARKGLGALVGGVLALSALAAGCGGGGEGAPAMAAEGNPPDAVEIVDFEFDPTMVTVEAGTEVVWTNRDNAAHTASAKDGSFDTGTLGSGESGRVTLDEPGTYAYICEFHPFMTGTIEVE